MPTASPSDAARPERDHDADIVGEKARSLDAGKHGDSAALPPVRPAVRGGVPWQRVPCARRSHESTLAPMRAALPDDARLALRQRVATAGPEPVATLAHVSVATLARAIRGARVCGPTHSNLIAVVRAA